MDDIKGLHSLFAKQSSLVLLQEVEALLLKSAQAEAKVSDLPHFSCLFGLLHSPVLKSFLAIKVVLSGLLVLVPSV